MNRELMSMRLRIFQPSCTTLLSKSNTLASLEFPSWAMIDMYTNNIFTRATVGGVFAKPSDALKHENSLIDLAQIGARAMPQRRRKRGGESVKNRSFADRSCVSTCPLENKHLAKYGKASNWLKGFESATDKEPTAAAVTSPDFSFYTVTLL